ncbi:MAG: radical SAM protein [Planctomycetota bacterium]
MEILLASSPHRDTFGYSMPPPGLLRLGGELKGCGFAVGLEDLAYRLAAGEIVGGEELCRSAATWLADRPAAVLGLSTMGATLPAAVAIARHYRALRPGVPIWIGGPGSTGTDVGLLEQFPWIDLVVRGEGDFVVPELLTALREGAREPGAGVAGVTWRDGDGHVRREADRPARKDLENVADYAWDLLPPLAAYKGLTGEPEGLTPLDSGRGCAYDCSFCTIGRYWQRRSRPLPAARLVAEILALRSMPGARQAYLCHDLFGADRPHALEVCERLIAAGAPVPFEVRARIDHLDPELLDRMARAGCYRVLLGVESASPAVRARHQKKLGPEIDPLAVVDQCEAVGIVPILSLILGLPGEGPEELEATLELCSRASLRRGVHLSLHLVNPQPGCGLGEEFAATSARVEGIAPDMALGSGESAEERELIEGWPMLFSTFHLLPPEAVHGGLEGLRHLASLAKHLPELWRRYPRTLRLLQRLQGGGVGDLWQRFAASGQSFAGYVRSQGDGLLNACLRWEQAALRVAARGPREADVDAIPRPTGECLVSPVDLGALAQALREDAPLPPLGAPAAYLVVPQGPGGAQRTLRISADTARLLEHFQTARPGPWQQAPGYQAAQARLQQSGLLTQTPAVP